MPVARVRNIPSIQEGSEKKKFTVNEAEAEEVYEIDTGEEVIERVIAKMKKFRNYPPAQFTYHAFGNRRNNWTVDKIKPIIEYARKHQLEVRAWEVAMSATNLVVVKDPDNSENSGWDLYQSMEGKFDSYGLASWYEFDKWGVPVYCGEDTQIEPCKHMGIWVGKSKEDCVVLC